MSTTALTVVVVVALIAGLFAASVAALYRRQLAAASFIAAAGFGVMHLGFVSMAWEAAATSEELPAIASLPTAAYDIPAWAAVALLATGIALSVLQRRREKALEKKFEEAFEHLFGPYEAEED